MVVSASNPEAGRIYAQVDLPDPEDVDLGPAPADSKYFGGYEEGDTIPRQTNRTRRRPARVGSPAGGTYRGPGPSFEVEPLYGGNSHYIDPQMGEFGSMHPATLTGIQVQLYEGGFLNLDEIQPGRWDPASASAMKELQTYANHRGMPWRAALGELRAGYNPALADVSQSGRGSGRRGGGGGGRSFVPEPYRPPDYATLSQSVKAQMRSALGRDPRDFEMELLTDELKSQHREAYDENVKAARAYFEAQVGSRSVSSMPEPTDVDPESRFKERFEELFQPEVDRLEREQHVNEASNRLVQNIAGLRSL